MAIDNTSIGSVLTIPDGLINNLEKVDDRIKKIQESARATGATFNTQFAGMTSNTNFLINNLDKIIGQLNTIGSAAQTAAQATMPGVPTGEYAGWDNLIGSMGMGGMGDTMQHLGITLSMLPDMLVGVFTGKTKIQPRMKTGYHFIMSAASCRFVGSSDSCMAFIS